MLPSLELPGQRFACRSCSLPLEKGAYRKSERQQAWFCDFARRMGSNCSDKRQTQSLRTEGKRAFQNGGLGSEVSDSCIRSEVESGRKLPKRKASGANWRKRKRRQRSARAVWHAEQTAHEWVGACQELKIEQRHKALYRSMSE
ncbi:hypothetical protein MPNT_60110 [Candidatus Methylacidithermus pantelleriae]|uniref:Uncharacterized protein n=1 Tax=Candidatus Methylacidithermus pantelleriae TaxID=2744239 RepID=A0A8J2BR58_9BACT|nr:hypothetical protein MPNT_60110 [Candidatus Methylacidithermus pantelleriae]